MEITTRQQVKWPLLTMYALQKDFLFLLMTKNCGTAIIIDKTQLSETIFPN